jgi:hypothetical protein
MTESQTMSRGLAAEERQNRVEARRSLRRALRGQNVRTPFFGTRLELTLFAIAATALLATPLMRASIQAKNDFTEFAARLRGNGGGVDDIVTGSLGARKPAPKVAAPAAQDARPRLRGAL